MGEGASVWMAGGVDGALVKVKEVSLGVKVAVLADVVVVVVCRLGPCCGTGWSA